MSAPTPVELQQLELSLLLEAIFRQSGLDFRQYALPSVKRRVMGRMTAEKCPTISDLLARALHDPACMERLLDSLVIHVTEMFRDPTCFAALRLEVIPLLRTYPFVRLWVAGCATGEEAYSLAILLEEAGLYDRCRIYATDVSEKVLATAQAGIFPLARMRDNTENYLRAGGQEDFSTYYTASHDHAILRPALRRNIFFTRHNLVTDSSFNEFNVVLCRNVLIYFNRELQDRVHHLFYSSLTPLGILVLGRQETVRFTRHAEDYDVLATKDSIYRRKR